MITLNMNTGINNMEIHSNITLTVLRLMNIILITLATTAWIIFYIRYKMVMVIAPISWLIHVLIYGIYRFFIQENPSNTDFMNIWTAILLMHGIVLLLLSAILSAPGFFKTGKEIK